MSMADTEIRLQLPDRIRLRDVARLDINAGETLVIWLEDIPRDETGEPLDIPALIKESLPDGVKVLVLDTDTRIAVVSQPQVIPSIDVHLDGRLKATDIVSAGQGYGWNSGR